MISNFVNNMTTYKIFVNTIWKCSFSLLACYWLKFTCFSLLVLKSLVIRCKFCSLLVAEVARCKKSLVTHYRSCSLQKITRYSLQNLLFTCCRSSSLEKITRSSLQSSLVTRCRSCSFQNITCYSC